MIGRRRTAVALMTALAVLATYSSLPASGTKWVTQRFGWDVSAANGAGLALPNGGRDTILIVGATNPVDSNRTVSLNTSNWAWEEALRSGYNAQSAGVASSGDSLISVALVTLTCVARTAGNRTDTIYAFVEPCFEGACGHSDIAHTGGTIAQAIPLVADPSNKWGGTMPAATTPYGLQTSAQVVFQGVMKVDPNSAVGAAPGLAFKPNFRLNLIPGGTSNAITLYRCRLSITYPQRAQP